MKKVFFSFHYELDNWRVNQIRNIGVVEGQKVCDSNEWEQIKRKGEQSIKNWINRQMKNCDCVIVLIGEKTHERKWVKYEVDKAKKMGIPVFGIFIHRLKDSKGKASKKGKNVFDVKDYEPDSYQEIRNNLESWIDKNTFSFFKFFGRLGLLIIVLCLTIFYLKSQSLES